MENPEKDPRKVIIMGAAGRDFHDFNCVYRDNEMYRVVAFTATQIPDISGRSYPAELAGDLYPDGVPIRDESELEALIREHDVDEVVFAYSDVTHTHVMDCGSRVIAAGADFRLLGARDTSLKSRLPVIAVCAVRTGCGKSQTSRYIAALLRDRGLKTAVIRHPMPYGDLGRQAVQRFATFEDLSQADCTIEEREEYEPHIEQGAVVFAGVDYHAILKKAEEEADVVLWDGGNNDLPFYVPDLHLVVADPLRSGHERAYHPGQANVIMADAVIINKVDSAQPDDVRELRASIGRLNPEAQIIEARSEVALDEPVSLRGRKVLVIEDGPTLTHGGMEYGAGTVIALR
ncbi:MAG: GTPase, partial [Deltaproteobacteria bacterium]|nr:GTPase [Deltaproteobacteria bacterium]